jgi:type IV pilus assembly protein PilM
MANPFQKSVSPIGLDLGAHSFKAVQLRGEGADQKIVAACCLPRRIPGAALEREELLRLAEGLERQGFLGSDVVVALPPARLMTSVLELPAKAANLPMADIASAEFCRINKKDSDAITLSYWELPPSARASRTTYAIGAGCLSSDADEFLDLVESSGFSVKAMDVASSATARACQSPESETSMTAILDLGWTSAVAIIIKSGIVIYERQINEAGLMHLVTALAAHSSIEARDAQDLIQQVGLLESTEGPGNADDLAGDCRSQISIHCGTMIDEIRQSFSYARHQYPDADLPTLLLTGGGAGIRGLTPFFQQALRLEVRAASPLDCVECIPALRAGATTAVITAMGLARFGAEVPA